MSVISFNISNCRYREINVKIFNNGKLQMTGVQSENEGRRAAVNIIKILKSIKYKCLKHVNELSPAENNLRGDYQIVYNSQTGRKNLYRWDYLVTDNPNYQWFDEDWIQKNIKLFGWKNYTDLKNHYGDVEWIKSDLSVLKKIIPDNNTDFNALTYPSNDNIVYKKILETPNTTQVSDYRIALINSDYSTKFLIKNNVLHRLLMGKYKIYSSFEPCDYPGVKSKFAWNINNTNPKTQGRCLCKTHCGRSKKNRICKMITICVFQSGNVIITGANQLQQIKDAYNFINMVFRDNYNILKRKPTDLEKSETLYNNELKRQSFLNKKKNVVYLKKSDIKNSPFTVLDCV